MSVRSRIRARLRVWQRAENGSATVEFVILFPVFIYLMLSSIEVGILTTRHVMLERGLDLAVREVRLNTGAPVGVDELRTMICNGAAVIPDCLQSVKVEMKPLNLRALDNIPPRADCVDVNSPAQPVRNFTNGAANELMILRACVLFDPIIETSAFWAYRPPAASGGKYALVSTSAFAMEPI